MLDKATTTVTHSAHGERNWSRDLVLSALQDLEEPVGSFIRAFPGRAALSDERDWLENWFVDLAARLREGEGPDLRKVIASAAEASDLSLLAKESVKSTVRLVSIRPHWFRGFREAPGPIRFESDLVVIDGRNSSGKTSISEAIEWVFTGQLSRRTSGEQGHPTELADCIANEFRPDEESTSVELAVEVDENLVTLERILKKDYSTIASDSPESDLLIDGEVASEEEERELFSRLFAGVHPILMQHNLRRFVHDDPSSRRQYFERLLQIDELTALVEKAVIGTMRAKEIPNPSGGTGLAALRDLANEVEKDRGAQGSKAAKELNQLERSDTEDVPALIAERLISLTDAFLGNESEGASDLPGCRERVEEAQRRQRESRLPLLASLEEAWEKPVPATSHLRDAVKIYGKLMKTS